MRGVDLSSQFLHTSRHLHRPRRVTEVASYGAQDRGNGVRGESGTTLGVELVDGLDQSDGRDLRDVLDGLSAIGVSTREVVDEWHVRLNELIADCGPLGIGGVRVMQSLEEFSFSRQPLIIGGLSCLRHGSLGLDGGVASHVPLKPNGCIVYAQVHVTDECGQHCPGEGIGLGNSR